MSNESDALLLGMRESERDSAELALLAAASGVADAAQLLEVANAELRRIETAIEAHRAANDSERDLDRLERDAQDARDTVTACHSALSEAKRVAAEYQDELAQLETVVRGMRAVEPAAD